MTAAAVNPLLRNSSASLARTRCKWSHLKAETKVSYNTWFKTLRVSHSFLCISSAALGLLHKRLKTRHNRASHHRCVNPNTYAEAICRCSLLGLSERCGGFGGLTTAGGATGKDILLLPEPTKSSREKNLCTMTLRQNETDERSVIPQKAITQTAEITALHTRCLVLCLSVLLFPLKWLNKSSF